ncbi:MAG: hypothetical protein JRI72_09080, partial [Deltaproteobacteria bacterium]|nr:hypothetical protein [Deltaproteobacteria bacterium]
MIPFPNVIAGILIGITNDAWIARLILPFGWGVAYCIYTSITRRDRRDEFVAHVKASVGELSGGYLI